jgi:excisionase family DNA binding protein
VAIVEESELRRELLRVEEAARVLGIGRTKVYELIAREELPVVRLGRAVRIPRVGLSTWIEMHTTGADELRRTA